MQMYAYRLKAGSFTAMDWYLAFSTQDIADEVARMNAEDTAQVWAADVHEVKMLSTFERALAGRLMGSATTAAKRIASRENGRKGGRPKKPNVGIVQ